MLLLLFKEKLKRLKLRQREANDGSVVAKCCTITAAAAVRQVDWSPRIDVGRPEIATHSDANFNATPTQAITLTTTMMMIVCRREKKKQATVLC